MNPQQTQGLGGLNPDQISAALAFATHQGEQNLPPPDVQPVAGQGEVLTPTTQAPQQPQNAPQATQTDTTPPTDNTPPTPPPASQDDLKGVEERLAKLVDELGKSLKDGQTKEMTKEMDEIKKTLKDLAK